MPRTVTVAGRSSSGALVRESPDLRRAACGRAANSSPPAGRGELGQPVPAAPQKTNPTRDEEDTTSSSRRWYLPTSCRHVALHGPSAGPKESKQTSDEGGQQASRPVTQVWLDQTWPARKASQIWSSQTNFSLVWLAGDHLAGRIF